VGKDKVFAPADAEMAWLIHHELARHGVDLRLGTSVTGIAEGRGRLAVSLSTGGSVECDLIILAAGVRPNASLAHQAGLDVGPTGGIIVDQHMRTSDPNIYAVGDAVEVTHLVSGQRAVIPLAGPAGRQGRIAADNALGRDTVYKDSQGTAICKVFDLAIGMTGLSEKSAKAANLQYEKVYIHPSSHADYYPGAERIDLKLLFDPRDGKVLGAQAVGGDGIDKRIDVLAVAIRAEMTVHDLKDQELSYAPPYGSARDPINYAGFVASNVLLGDVALCHWHDLARADQDRFLLDVRTTLEVLAGAIPDAVNIPIDKLRERIGELPKDREIIAYCQSGLRSYLACRILKQNGLTCRNLSGGYLTYRAATEVTSNDPANEA